MLCCLGLQGRDQPLSAALLRSLRNESTGPGQGSQQTRKPPYLLPPAPYSGEFFFLSAPCSHDSDSSWRLINNQSSQPLASVDAALDRDGSDCPVCQKPEERGGVHMSVCVCVCVSVCVCARTHCKNCDRQEEAKDKGCGHWCVDPSFTIDQVCDFRKICLLGACFFCYKMGIRAPTTVWL